MDTNTVDLNAVATLVLSGKYLIAVGTVLVPILAFLNMLLSGRFDWFKTKLGKYVLAYVVTFGSYLAFALQSGAPIDLHWLLTALGTAVMASGVLDHWRDIITVAKKPSAIVSAAAMIVFVVACSDCAGTTPTGGSVVTTVVDCAAPGGDLAAKIEAEALKMAAIAFGPDLNKWNEIEVLAVNDGLTIGGCAFSKVVNDWLTKKSLVGSSAVLESQQVKSTFESYRSSYAGNATFHFKDMDL